MDYRTLFVVTMCTVGIAILILSAARQRKYLQMQQESIQRQQQAMQTVDESLAISRKSLENQEKIIALLEKIVASNDHPSASNRGSFFGHDLHDGQDFRTIWQNIVFLQGFP